MNSTNIYSSIHSSNHPFYLSCASLLLNPQGQTDKQWTAPAKKNKTLLRCIRVNTPTNLAPQSGVQIVIGYQDGNVVVLHPHK